MKRGAKHTEATKRKQRQNFMDGSRNIGPAKLSIADVIEIRRRRALGEEIKKLAKDFEMSTNGIAQILNGTNWKHVPGAMKGGVLDPLRPLPE